MQQISLAQKVTEAKMDGLKKEVKAMMNNMEAKMNGIEEKLKDNMEDLKIDLTNLLQEILTDGKRVVKETHDESEINVNHDFIDSKVGLKAHHVPKINRRKLDGKDPATWILQMEQFFDLNSVQNTQKVHMETLYLKPNQIGRAHV